MPEGQTITHPSFGKITLHMTNGHGQRCYGSDLEHDHTMRIVIHESSYERNLSHDWYRLGKHVVEISMTPLQWAEFLSSQSKGDGTPCTFVYRADQGHIDPPPAYRAPHHQVFRDEAQERITAATAATREAEEMLTALMAAGPVKKGDLQAVLGKLRRAQQDMQSNTAFVMESFEEATARVVHDAKEEINAHHSRVVEQYGLRALAAAQGMELPAAKVQVLDATPEQP